MLLVFPEGGVNIWPMGEPWMLGKRHITTDWLYIWSVATGGLTNPRPWRGRCRAGYSDTGGPALPRKRAPYKKNIRLNR